MPGPPSSDPAAWRWRGEWWIRDRDRDAGLHCAPLPHHPCISGTKALAVGWVGRRGAQPHRGPSSPTRHPFPAVSGAPTAQRAPASGAMGPAPPRMTVESTNERSSGLVTAQRPHAGLPTVSSAHGRESACGLGSSRGPVSLEVCFPGVRGLGACILEEGQGLYTESEPAVLGLKPSGLGRRAGILTPLKEERLGSRLVTDPVSPPPGETRRILSVQPTYDWTCFSHSLLNVSPMPVESSPPLPCPTPCHLLPNCTSCLASKGADGGWQHCVWSSSLQQVMPMSSAQPWHPLPSPDIFSPPSCPLFLPHIPCLLPL